MYEKLDKPTQTITINGIDAIITPEKVNDRWNVYVLISGAAEPVPVGHEAGPFETYDQAVLAGEEYAKAAISKLTPRQD